MEAQEIFDKVYRHLIRQGRPAMIHEYGASHCEYRTENGLRCAVGCLIPKKLYDKSMEGNDVESLLFEMKHDPCYPKIEKLKGAWGITTKKSRNFRMLVQLQQVHDAFSFNHGESPFWKEHVTEGMKRIARNFRLKMPAR